MAGLDIKSMVNGAMSDAGLIVSAVFEDESDRSLKVDVWDLNGRLLEFVPLSTLELDFNGTMATSTPLKYLVPQVSQDNLLGTLLTGLRLMASRPGIGSEVSSGQFVWTPVAELELRASRIAHFLQRELPESNSFVGIMGVNSLEWVLAFLGIALSGRRFVPIHQKASMEYLDHIVNEADLKAIFVDAAGKAGGVQEFLLSELRVMESQGASLEGATTLCTTQQDKRSLVQHDNYGEARDSALEESSKAHTTPNVMVGRHYAVTVDNLELRASPAGKVIAQLGIGVHGHVLSVTEGWVEFACSVGQGWLANSISDGQLTLAETSAEDVFMVLYTSGSTGKPKGAMIPSAVFNHDLCDRLVAVPGPSPVALQYNPLSVSSAPYNLLTDLLSGGRVAVYADVRRTFEVAPIIGPTIMSGAPQLWAALYKQFQTRERSCEDDLARLQLRQEAREWLGRRLMRINCGGALPCAAVMEWLKTTFDQAWVSENYSSTETGGIASGESGGLQRIRMGVNFRLEDYNNYRSTDTPPRGEICVKTQRMTIGYLNRPDLTREAFTPDGFFRTGDIGELVEPGCLRIIDRKKAFFKLSNSEWVSPEAVEVQLIVAPEVQQVFVHGDSSHSHVVALAVSDCESEVVLKAFRREGHGLRHFEIPCEVHIVKHRWVEDDLLTASGKLNRPALRERFSEELQAMLHRTSCGEEAASDEDLIVRLVREGSDSIAWDSLVWTSIFATRAAAALREAFGVDVPVAALLGRAPLSDVVNHVRRVHDLAAFESDDVDMALGEFDFPDFVERPGTLLTGATGHVGACVLSKLVTYTRHHVICLVRGESQDIAKQRLLKGMRDRGYLDADVLPKNLEVLVGDLSLTRLGLAEAIYESLAERVGCIIHAAAAVHHLHAYDILRHTNVDGLRTLLQLASLAPMRFLNISTLSAKSGGSGYGRSKWVADRLMEQACAKGLNGTTLPLGMIGPDRTTGASNTSDWLIRFVIGCIQLGKYCSAGSVEVMTVDDAAAAIVESISSNLWHAPEVVLINLSHMMRCIAARLHMEGRGLLEVPLSEWQQHLAQLPETNAMFPLRHYYNNGLGRKLSGVHGYSEESVTKILNFLRGQHFL